MNAYFDAVHNLLKTAEVNNSETLEHSAALVAECFLRGGILHTFGTGHGAALAIELFHRAGSPAAVNPIIDDNLTLHLNARSSSVFERLPDYAIGILARYRIERGDVFLIASNSGRNSVPIDMALRAKELGMKVIALTSLPHSQSQLSRHASGKRLFELADVVLDNGVPTGDAIMRLDGLPEPICAASTVIGAALVQALIYRVAQLMLAQGVQLQVWISSNVDGGDEHNTVLEQQYENRIRNL
jgi:uncharacterized phosphosugar-binding protein